MATFSNNGTSKQMFIATAQGAVSSASANGTIDAVAGEAGTFHLQYKSPGGVLRSDIVKNSDIVSIKAIKYDAMARGLAKYEVALDSAVNSGAPVAGQDYLLRFTFFEYGSISYEDQYIKYAAVRATTGMTAAKFYVELLKSAVLNFSRESVPLLSFSLTDADGSPVITYNAFTKAWTGVANEAAAIAAAPTKLVIEEIEQPYVLGLKSSDPVKVSILSDQILVSGDYVNWGVVTKVASTTLVGNGKKVADLEYFYLGERGDQYRNVGFPFVLQSTYLANPALVYNVIEITYNFVGEGVDPQKSLKSITIACPAETAASAVQTLANAIINDVEAVSGVTVADLAANPA